MAAQSIGYNPGSGLGGMLKEGSRHFSNSSGGSGGESSSVTIRNLEACMELCQMVSSSYGPNGRCKLVMNHLGKINVTSDCAAILKEIDIVHPAAQLLQRAVQKQEETCGDHTNYVLTLAGELCYQTIHLLEHVFCGGSNGGSMMSNGGVGGGSGNNNNNVLNDIVSGYAIALQKIENELLHSFHLPQQQQEQQQQEEEDTNNTFIKILKPVLMTKQYGCQDVLAPLVANACLSTMKSSKSLTVNPASIRTVKILGSSMEQCQLVQGYVAQRGLEVPLSLLGGQQSQSQSPSPSPLPSPSPNNHPKNLLQNCRIAVFACAIEASTTEAKGTVTMTNAEELKSYNISEEQKMNDIIASIHATGCNFVVSGGNVSDMALHYLSKYNLPCLKMGSRWELRRLCQAIQARALVRLGPPTPEEIGLAHTVQCDVMIGSRKVVIFSQQSSSSSSQQQQSSSSSSSQTSQLSTIILRATTTSVLNDLERAVEDGVRTMEIYTKSLLSQKQQPKQTQQQQGLLLYGGGAIEMAMSTALQDFADTVPGLQQYSIRAFAKSLQVIPRILAQNAGWETPHVMANLQKVHYNHYHNNNNNNTTDVCDMGVDIDIVKSSSETNSTTTTTTTQDSILQNILNNATKQQQDNTNNDTDMMGIASMKEKQIVDLLTTKKSAIRLAVDATMTILKIDQIIMSKPSGGPTPQ